MAETLVCGEALSKSFVTRSVWGVEAKRVEAVRDVDIRIRRGHIHGLVGETGSGKTTLGRMLLMLERPSAGRVWLGNTELTALDANALRRIRPRMQVIFQNPRTALNPALPVRNTLAFPLRHVLGRDRREVQRRSHELLEFVRLPNAVLEAYPRELSGGQLQRVEIARALALKPEFLVADEPVSSLDVSVRGEILNLLIDLRDLLRLTVLFIGHDMDVIRRIPVNDLSVMYQGGIVGQGPLEEVLLNPRHEYIAELI